MILALTPWTRALLEKISEFAEALPYGYDARGTFHAKASRHLPETMLPLAQYLDDRLNRDGQKLSVREAQLLAGKIKDMDRLEKTLPACAGATPSMIWMTACLNRPWAPMPLQNGRP